MWHFHRGGLRLAADGIQIDDERYERHSRAYIPYFYRATVDSPLYPLDERCSGQRIMFQADGKPATGVGTGWSGRSHSVGSAAPQMRRSGSVRFTTCLHHISILYPSCTLYLITTHTRPRHSLEHPSVNPPEHHCRESNHLRRFRA